jgi:hypothetical protein
MNYKAAADKIIEAINARRIALGLKDTEHGKLIMLTTSQSFNDWVNADPDHSSHIAMATKCPLFQHATVDDLPADPRATVVEAHGITVGFMVDRLDQEAWQRKRF